MKIRAAVLEGVGQPFRIDELELEEPGPDEVLVDMRAAGVCHSDWHVVTGATRHPLPAVLGHEGAGVVLEVGKRVHRVRPGDLVALNWAPCCGECYYCLAGRPSLCGAYVDAIWAGTLLDGTTRLSRRGQPVFHYSSLACFAERTVVPSSCCVRLDPAIPVEIAALIGCAVTTGVGAVLNTVRVRAGDSVVVWGAGGVGLSCVLAARLAGASRILVVDRSPQKLETLPSFGATDAILAGPDAIARIREQTGGRGADWVFEAVGAPEVQETCLHAVRPGGTLVLVGLSPMGSATNLPGALITREEKTVTGSYYGSANAARDFPRFAELYRQGRLDLDRLVTRRFSLEEINHAYETLLDGSMARGLILF